MHQESNLGLHAIHAPCFHYTIHQTIERKQKHSRSQDSHLSAEEPHKHSECTACIIRHTLIAITTNNLLRLLSSYIKRPCEPSLCFVINPKLFNHGCNKSEKTGATHFLLAAFHTARIDYLELSLDIQKYCAGD